MNLEPIIIINSINTEVHVFAIQKSQSRQYNTQSGNVLVFIVVFSILAISLLEAYNMVDNCRTRFQNPFNGFIGIEQTRKYSHVTFQAYVWP